MHVGCPGEQLRRALPHAVGVATPEEPPMIEEEAQEVQVVRTMPIRLLAKSSPHAGAPPPDRVRQRAPPPGRFP